MNGRARSWDLGVDEVSGLGWRRDPRSETTELIAVSDRTTTIARLAVDDVGLPRADRRRVRPHRVHGLPADIERSAAGSQWEGVAGDGEGRLVVLCERTSDLLVISPDFRFERRIGLRHPWRGDRQAGLEALLLLTNGHVLAAKQRSPLRLLEFGPAGDEPMGVSATSVLPTGAPAELSTADEVHCLATWRFADDRLRSVNDMAVDSGYLYVISSASRRIARVRLPLLADATVHIEGGWPLPDSVADGRDSKAEGLLVDERLGVLVGVDAHGDRDNLYLIGQLPDPGFAGR